LTKNIAIKPYKIIGLSNFVIPLCQKDASAAQSTKKRRMMTQVVPSRLHFPKYKFKCGKQFHFFYTGMSCLGHLREIIVKRSFTNVF